MSEHQHHDRDANAPGVHEGAAHAVYVAHTHAPAAAARDHQHQHHQHYDGPFAASHQRSATSDSPGLPQYAYERGYVRSVSSSSHSQPRSPRRMDGSVQQQQQQQQYHQPAARYGQDQSPHGDRPLREFGNRPPSPHHHQSDPQQQIRDAPPSSTLIVRGLSPSVTEIMVF